MTEYHLAELELGTVVVLDPARLRPGMPSVLTAATRSTLIGPVEEDGSHRPSDWSMLAVGSDRRVQVQNMDVDPAIVDTEAPGN